MNSSILRLFLNLTLFTIRRPAIPIGHSSWEGYEWTPLWSCKWRKIVQVCGVGSNTGVGTTIDYPPCLMIIGKYNLVWTCKGGRLVLSGIKFATTIAQLSKKFLAGIRTRCIVGPRLLYLPGSLSTQLHFGSPTRDFPPAPACFESMQGQKIKGVHHSLAKYLIPRRFSHTFAQFHYWRTLVDVNPAKGGDNFSLPPNWLID